MLTNEVAAYKTAIVGMRYVISHRAGSKIRQKALNHDESHIFG